MRWYIWFAHIMDNCPAETLYFLSTDTTKLHFFQSFPKRCIGYHTNFSFPLHNTHKHGKSVLAILANTDYSKQHPYVNIFSFYFLCWFSLAAKAAPANFCTEPKPPPTVYPSGSVMTIGVAWAFPSFIATILESSILHIIYLFQSASFNLIIFNLK